MVEPLTGPAGGDRPLRVLVVDDDPEDVELVIDLLEEGRPGAYSIRAAATFEEGLKALAEEEPDIGLVDYRLGARSGLEFIREAGVRSPMMPAVLMTGGNGGDIDRRALEAGAVDYLPKSELTADRLERAVRYAAERARRQRVEAHFRALIENSSDIVAIVGQDGEIRYVSPSVSRLLGHEPDERVGAGVLSEVHPEDRPAVEAELRGLLEGSAGEARRFQPYRIRHRDGSWRVLDTLASNQLHEPSIRGLVMHCRDVTTEMSIRERIRFQADLLAAVGQAVIATDMEGEILYWNAAAEEIYGWTREEALGRSTVELTTPAATQRQAEEIMVALRAGQSWSGEFEVRRKDGSTFVALVTDSPITDADGTLRGIIGVSSDISRLKETEAALRERVKELRTLHQVSRVLNSSAGSIDDRLQRVVETLPDGWVHPDVTESRLSFGARVYASPGFTETEWMLSAPVVFGDAEPGRIDVALIAERPPRDIGPFLREERDLLDNVALLMGDVLRRERLAQRIGRTVDALDEAVLVMRGRTIQDVNPAAERIFGYTRDQLVGSTTEPLHVDEASFRRFGEESIPVLDEEGVFRASFPMRRSDGTVFHAEQTVSVLDPEEGLDAGAVSVVRDVSEQARAERALRASEERFRLIAESIDDVFWVSTADLFELEYVSPAFAEIWGRPVEAVLEDPLLWTAAVLPSDRDRFLEVLQPDRQEGYEVDYRIVRPDGEVRWIFDRAFPVHENGELVRFIGVAEDITDRKLAEERFSVLSQEAADGIHIIAPDGRILFATPAAEAVLGYPPGTLQGRNALELVHPKDREAVRDMIGAVVHEPGKVARLQYRGLTRDGETRQLESVGRNRIDHPGIRGLVVTTRDVTERHRLEEQLRQSQKMEAVGRLAGGIAHDFNNLLTVIRSQTDLLLIDTHDEGVPDAASLVAELETIQAAADRAAALTSQLLAFSREQVLQPRVVDLSEIVSDMARLLERVIGEDVTLERDLDPDLPAVRVDPGQLEQAIMNLAVNARDAMPGGGALTLRTRSHQVGPDQGLLEGLEPGSYVLLEVADTGTGMDAHTLSHVFEPFFTTKEKGKGTGLGLAMVYGVVTQSGGTVRVESDPGSGTTFRLSFPAVDERPERTVRPDTRTAAHDAIAHRILVVEDDDAVRRVTIRILERAGLEVIAVGTAEDAVIQLQADDSFDLLLTDLVLPGMSGRALVDHVKSDGLRVPIIVMSGYAADSPGERGDLPEEIVFVQKPFTPKGLVQAVRDVLGLA